MQVTTASCDHCHTVIKPDLATKVSISTNGTDFDFCSGCGYTILAALKKYVGDTSSQEYDQKYLNRLTVLLKV